ncbi:MAG: TolC family protein [Nitrospirae bacterium]|nr:TolC family protein [Nitrospirota bacterium]
MHSNTEVRSQKSEVRMNPPVSPFEKEGLRGIFALLTAYCLLFTAPAFAEELKLQPLIDEALKNNHEILMLEARESVSKFKIPQAESLPDPMFMFGYLNDGVRDLYTFDDEMASDSQWMFSVSQMFPYPGKLSLKSEMASRDAESILASLDAARLRVAARVKELYYELFLTYKSIDLVKDMSALFSRIEEAALARYSTGMAPQQEVLMAQTEKYMLLEKEEMFVQKVQSLEAMINSTLGRDGGITLGRPVELLPKEYNYSIEELLKATYETSPEIKVKDRMIAGAETKVEMAKKEYYPDFTVSANYFAKNKYFEDMWGLTATVNIPIFYKTKQRQAVLEAEASLSGIKHELDDIKYMLSSNIRDNYSMLKSAEKLMDLYKNGLIPKTYQSFESAIAGYRTGNIEAITVMTTLKSLIDYELLNWKQFIEREKAIARLEALTTVKSQ